MLVLACIFILYFFFLIILLTGWQRAVREQAQPAHGREQLITIIIPARNEEYTIGNLLNDLTVQEFKKFEIIVVNDHSDDETLWALSKFDLKNLRILNNQGSGKKAAISTGVRAAKGTIVVTTDADCSVPPLWLKRIHDQFSNKQVMMVFGGVRIQGDSGYFASLQAIEFSSLIGSGAATATLGFPTLCSGANLAFRKQVFTAVKGYQDNLSVPSGDDEFLMRKIEKRYPGSVRFLSHPETVVKSKAVISLEDFFQQRVRWASKWRFNTSLFTKTLAVCVVLVQVSFLVNWILIFSPWHIQSLFLLVLKMILEAAFLLQVCHFLQTRWNWLAFFGLQLLYPLYVLVTATASFIMPFQWKNRIFRP